VVNKHPILQPLSFTSSLIAAPITSMRPRTIKFTDKIIRPKYQISSKGPSSVPPIVASIVASIARPIMGHSNKNPTGPTSPTSTFITPGRDFKGRSLMLVYLRRNHSMSSNTPTSTMKKKVRKSIAGIMLGTSGVWQPGR